MNWFFILTEKFGNWMIDLHVLENNWLCVCAMFMYMACSFLNFVCSYRAGDSIVVDTGYDFFCVSVSYQQIAQISGETLGSEGVLASSKIQQFHVSGEAAL